MAIGRPVRDGNFFLYKIAAKNQNRTLSVQWVGSSLRDGSSVLECLLQFADVRTCTSAEPLLEQIDAGTFVDDLLILDMILPTPRRMTDDDTEFGARTAFPLIRLLRGEGYTTPVLVFTSVNDADVVERLQSMLNVGYVCTHQVCNLDLIRLLGSHTSSVTL